MNSTTIKPSYYVWDTPPLGYLPPDMRMGDDWWGAVDSIGSTEGFAIECSNRLARMIKYFTPEYADQIEWNPLIPYYGVATGSVFAAIGQFLGHVSENYFPVFEDGWFDGPADAWRNICFIPAMSMAHVIHEGTGDELHSTDDQLADGSVNKLLATAFMCGPDWGEKEEWQEMHKRQLAAWGFPDDMEIEISEIIRVFRGSGVPTPHMTDDGSKSVWDGFEDVADIIAMHTGSLFLDYSQEMMGQDRPPPWGDHRWEFFCNDWVFGKAIHDRAIAFDQRIVDCAELRPIIKEGIEQLCIMAAFEEEE